MGEPVNIEILNLEKNIQRIRQNNNFQEWLGGDFNLGGIEWHNYSIKSKALNTKQCKQLCIGILFLVVCLLFLV
jgi:hypothetical protein